ncbi:unnamed protein product [Paramecium primaurelia]|uniref:Transmembrane protein n=1 Tax=Paramecium primaurelia TaxID=5886 RepID=A0A8S1PUZ1_PARPR|nr:unnamed protein product [Paramecium primaurelia]
MLNNEILFLCLFTILNPIIVFIMRFYYKIIQKDCCFHQPVSSSYFIDDTQCHYICFLLNKIFIILFQINNEIRILQRGNNFQRQYKLYHKFSRTAFKFLEESQFIDQQFQV